MGIEFELKYKATPRQLQQLREDLNGEEKVFEMRTAYYDTPTGQLSQRHYTLRRRMENELSVCTFKMPTEGIGRREWETECERIEDGIEKLCKLGAPEELLKLTAEGLVNICGARFIRIAKTVVLGESVVEIALDEGVLTGGDRQMLLCEMEVELKAGEQSACVAFAKMLAEKYGFVPEGKSKFRRALDLYRGEA